MRTFHDGVSCPRVHVPGVPRHVPRQPRPRRAFTLIELLVALVLLDCGLLAIVGCGAVIARATRTSTARTEAIAAAQSRVEQLVASICDGGTTGSLQTNRWRETWSVARDIAGKTREIRVSIDYGDGALRRSLTFHSRAPC